MNLQVQQADAIDEIKLREVYRGADQFAAWLLVAPTLEVRAQAILRSLDDGPDALLRACALAQTIAALSSASQGLAFAQRLSFWVEPEIRSYSAGS